MNGLAFRNMKVSSDIKSLLIGFEEAAHLMEPAMKAVREKDIPSHNENLNQGKAAGQLQHLQAPCGSGDIASEESEEEEEEESEEEDPKEMGEDEADSDVTDEDEEFERKRRKTRSLLRNRPEPVGPDLENGPLKGQGTFDVDPGKVSFCDRLASEEAHEDHVG